MSYPGRHAVAPGKSQTYSVEADNAEVRHYLARLGRLGRNSRCFLRSIDALRRAVKLFVLARPGSGTDCARILTRRHPEQKASPGSATACPFAGLSHHLETR